MSIPTVTREYTPCSRRNSRKTMRLRPRQETRPDSHALHAEQYHIENQSHKEPWFAWWKSRVPKNTLTSLKLHWCHQKNVKFFGVSQVNSRWCLTPLYWIWSNPPFPIKKTGGLSYFRQLVILTEAPVSSLVEHQFQHRNSKKAPWMPYHLEKRAHSQDSIEEVGQLSTSTSGGAFLHQ